ncbi:segregation and condensation protein B [Rhodoligotrophos appendicifer]|uniref:SMC-Scp complex subunit ScpB n=1 Tax=Rhodoligotrophos appendicifer TaxID=987056 RepID=UPI0011869571|nr:SMC-Scp complex subunit ScpB [Rhodoligotrophos appendicifer]
MITNSLRTEPFDERLEIADNVTRLPRTERINHLRVLEAVLFASPVPLSDRELAVNLPDEADVIDLLSELQAHYSGRGVQLIQVAGKWNFRTAPDLASHLASAAIEHRRLSRAATEVLAIIAYHQPVTRAEIEEIRGVSLSRGTLDVLLEMGWICMRGRRRTPGRPVTFATTENFLSHFGLNELGDLPGLAELKLSGLLEPDVASDFEIPVPRDNESLGYEEDPVADDMNGALATDLISEKEDRA